MEKTTREEVGKVIKSWENVIRHFQDLFKAKGPSYLDFLDGVWLWSQRSTDASMDRAISAAMVKDLGILRDAYLEQMEEIDAIEKLNQMKREFLNTMSTITYELRQEVKQLKAENRALKTSIDKQQ